MTSIDAHLKLKDLKHDTRIDYTYVHSEIRVIGCIIA